MKQLRYFDAFAGIGGFSEGIQRTIPSARCIGYSEVNTSAIQIYEKHFPNHVSYGDITKINPEELPDFDMWCSGFPCQSFSVSGKRGGINDIRGILFFDIIRICKFKQPKYIFLENVPGLLSIKHEEKYIFDIFMEELCNIGYCIDFRILNSKNFGVPQNRRRIYILAIRKDLLDVDSII